MMICRRFNGPQEPDPNLVRLRSATPILAPCGFPKLLTQWDIHLT
jgi:hypothetical protein